MGSVIKFQRIVRVWIPPAWRDRVTEENIREYLCIKTPTRLVFKLHDFAKTKKAKTHK